MNKTDKLNLIENAKELYSNPAFRRVSKSTMPNRFLLLYYVREYAKEKVVFTIDFNNFETKKNNIRLFFIIKV